MGGTPYREIVVVMFGLVHEVPVTAVRYSHVNLKWVQKCLRKASDSAQTVALLSYIWWVPGSHLCRDWALLWFSSVTADEYWVGAPNSMPAASFHVISIVLFTNHYMKWRYVIRELIASLNKAINKQTYRMEIITYIHKSVHFPQTLMLFVGSEHKPLYLNTDCKWYAFAFKSVSLKPYKNFQNMSVFEQL